MGFSCQGSEALVVFIYVVVFHPQVFDLHSHLGVSMSVQESVIEGVEEVEPCVWFFITSIEGVSLDSDEVSDEGTGYKSEGEGYFALIGV